MQRKSTSVLYSGTRAKRVVFGVCFAGIALYCDHGAHEDQRVLIQAGLWWAAPMVLVFMEMRGIFKRPRLRYLSIAFVPIHTYIVYSVWAKKLPFESSLTVMFLMLVEYVVLFIALLRIGQEVDPQGPLGLTEAERRTRAMIRLNK